jgi:hypothetical protein
MKMIFGRKGCDWELNSPSEKFPRIGCKSLDLRSAMPQHEAGRIGVCSTKSLLSKTHELFLNTS